MGKLRKDSKKNSQLRRNQTIRTNSLKRTFK